MLKVVLFESGEQRAQRLLIVGHHLAVDGVSWRILVEDLGTVYEQLEAGVAVRLPAKTSSLPEWSRRLREYGGSAAVREVASGRRKDEEWSGCRWTTRSVRIGCSRWRQWGGV